MLTIERSEVEELEDIGGWVLLYGRRKVGKTFILRNKIRHDVYVTVSRDGFSYATGLPMERISSFEALVNMIGPALKDGKTVIVDEFQRLPERFIDEVGTFHPAGRLILSGSSMKVVERVIGTSSPLLGLASPFKLGLVRPVDVLRSFGAYPPETAMPLASYLRDPWLTQILGDLRSLDSFLRAALRTSRIAVPALIGEVFVESERKLSQVYEGIIRALGSRIWSPGDVAQRLHETGILRTGSATEVMQYISNLREMGLVDKVNILGKKRRRAYMLSSNIMDTFYYLVDKHRIDEEERPWDELRDNLKGATSRAVQRFVGTLFAQTERGQLEYSFDPELDFIVTSGRKRSPRIVGEVRWGKYSKKDVRDFSDKVEDMGCRKAFIVPKVTTSKEVAGVDVLGAEDLVNIAHRWRG